MRVCVFCGSGSGTSPEYTKLAERLGRTIATRGLGLVYGGANVGLMKTVADAALAESGEVIGVLPHQLADRELAHEGLTELHLVDGMLDRKALMFELSDAFVTLPGGLGTLDELFEALTWTQIRLHQKPTGLLDSGTYYDALLTFLDHATREGFIRDGYRHLLVRDTDPDHLLDALLPAPR